MTQEELETFHRKLMTAVIECEGVQRYLARAAAVFLKTAVDLEKIIEKMKIPSPAA